MSKKSLNEGEVDIKQFKRIKRIGKGGFCVVYQVEDKKTKELLAAKVIDCDDNEEKCNEMIKREISIMMYAKHPTIIKFIGYSKSDFLGENNITIIMELAKNGSLRSVLKQIQEGNGPKNYTNTTRQIILIGVSRAMKYLHDRNIIHRDLKTDNVLLDEEFHPHISDFGFSKFYDIGHSYSQTQFGGTLPYEAPEIIRQNKYNNKVDVYSFSILMYEILTDSVPYPELEGGDLTDFDFKSKIVNELYRPKFKFPIKKSFQQLIEKCWSDDPNERPSFDEIFSKLSNKNDGHEDFMLDDVDADEVNLYIEDITEVTDGTEKLLKRISELETENKNLQDKVKVVENEKKELKQVRNELDQTKQQEECKKEKNQANESINARKSDNKQYTQSIIVGGFDKFNELGEKPNKKDKNGYPIISPPVKLSFDPSSLLSYSSYSRHSVLVTSDGSLKGIGNNCEGRISATLQKTLIDEFTDFCIKDDSGRQLAAVSAVCYSDGTLYMFSKNSGNERQLVLCDSSINGGDPVFLDIGNHHPVSLFGGNSNSAAIGSEGEVIFINRNSVINSPNSPITAVSLPDGEKASSVACCDQSVVVLSSNGRVFFSEIQPNRALKFSIVSELSDHQIVCVSGTYGHFLAVSKEGRVFGRGSNGCGQLGLGEGTKSVSSFTEISSLFEYKIRAAYAGSNHSLFETREGKIISCGFNIYGELLLSSITCEKVCSPTETTITRGAAFCIAGGSMSAVFIGNSPPRNIPNIRIHD